MRDEDEGEGEVEEARRTKEDCSLNSLYFFTPIPRSPLFLTSLFLSLQGATRVLRYHSNSVAKALVDLFPDIGLDVTRIL